MDCDLEARRLRACTCREFGDANRALADLNHVLGKDSDHAEVLVSRAITRAPALARAYLVRAPPSDLLGRTSDAQADRDRATALED